MLNLKKVIALVCVFALALTTVAFGATYTDVAEDSAYYEAVETLNKLGIVTGYEDGTFKPEDGVTRAEMAALIARIQGYGETAKAAASTGFADVPASHWASGYIANAAGMGIINGYGDGNFGPEDPVLYEQAVKMVMATLGYTPFAEKNGGYPTGYLAAAQRYNVSLAVANAAVGQEANRGTVAQLLENALDTPLMVQAGWNTNGEVEYKIAEGELTTEFVWDATLNSGAGGYAPVTTTKGYKTLMSENLGYVKIRGILYANDYTSIYGTKNIDTTEESKVWIAVVDDYGTENKKFINKANNEYLVGEIDVDGLLGRSVIAYTKANAKDDFELLSIAIDTNRNDELVIGLDVFAGHDTTVGKECVKYYKDGDNDVTTAKVEAGIDVVLNGNGGTLTSLNSLAGSLYGGSITLIDNDEVNGYDLAIVDRAETGVVKKVVEDGINFYNALPLFGDKFIELDADDETYVVVIKKDGEVIDASALNEFDVLSVYADTASAKYIVAEVVANQVVGTITAKKNSTTSATGTAFEVNDAWYDVAEGAYKRADLDVNEGGTLYIDQFGKIAAFIEDSALAGGTAANYGYVLGVAVEEAAFGGTTADLKVQMLTADGVKIMPVKSNARFEDASTVDIDFDLTAWVVNDDNSNASSVGTSPSTGGYDEWNAILGSKNTVVQYVTNAAGYITKITEAGHDTTKFKTSSMSTGSVKYDAENSKFDTTAGYVDADTIVFIVDGDAANCSVGTLADLDHDNVYAVNLAYADKKAEDTNVIVVTYASIQTSTTSNIAVIKEVGNGTNKDGEPIYNITYLLGGEEVTADTTADAATTISGLNAGDIVKVKVGSAGTITNLTKVYDFAADVRDFTSASTADATAAAYTNLYQAKEVFAGGKVVSYKETSTEIELSRKDNTSATAPYNPATTTSLFKLSRAENVYVVDATGRALVVKNGSDANYKYFENLYDASMSAETFEVTVGSTVSTGVSQANALKYADHVYVREYDGRVTDVVIIKGANKITKE